MSVAGSRLAIVAPVEVPSANVTLMLVALSTTWSAVRICPVFVTTTPLPRAPVGSPLGLGVALAPGFCVAPGLSLAAGARSVWMSTSDGSIVLNTSSERGGPGVWEASTLSTVSVTSRVVIPGLAGNRAT